MNRLRNWALLGILSVTNITNAVTQYFSYPDKDIKVTTDSHATAFTNLGWAADVVVRGEQINGKQKGKVKLEVTGKQPDALVTVMVQTENETNGDYFGGIEKLSFQDSSTNTSMIAVEAIVPREPSYPYKTQFLKNLIVKDNKSKTSTGRMYLIEGFLSRAENDKIIADIDPTYNQDKFGGSYFNGDFYGMYIYQSAYMNDGAKLVRLNDLGTVTSTTPKTAYVDLFSKKLKTNFRGPKGSVDNASLSWVGWTGNDNPRLLPTSEKRNRDGSITAKYNLTERDLY